MCIGCYSCLFECRSVCLTFFREKPRVLMKETMAHLFQPPCTHACAPLGGLSAGLREKPIIWGSMMGMPLHLQYLFWHYFYIDRIFAFQSGEAKIQQVILWTVEQQWTSLSQTGKNCTHVSNTERLSIQTHCWGVMLNMMANFCPNILYRGKYLTNPNNALLYYKHIALKSRHDTVDGKYTASWYSR